MHSLELCAILVFSYFSIQLIYPWIYKNNCIINLNAKSSKPEHLLFSTLFDDDFQRNMTSRSRLKYLAKVSKFSCCKKMISWYRFSLSVHSYSRTRVRKYDVNNVFHNAVFRRTCWHCSHTNKILSGHKRVLKEIRQPKGVLQWTKWLKRLVKC